MAALFKASEAGAETIILIGLATAAPNGYATLMHVRHEMPIEDAMTLADEIL